MLDYKLNYINIYGIPTLEEFKNNTMYNKEKAIILLSGGLDSCVTASIADKNNLELAFLHMNYGQLTEDRELLAFNKIAHYYNVEHKLIINVSHLSEIGNSCLTDNSIEVPKANLDNTNIPISYVPFRNANILAAAVSWAEAIDAKQIHVGAVEEDSSGYPDCREIFFNAFQNVINLGTKPKTKIKIKTPLINLSKKEIVLKGLETSAPLHLTWSCYKNHDIPCNQCDSCILRQRGFLEAGKNDPLVTI